MFDTKQQIKHADNQQPVQLSSKREIFEMERIIRVRIYFSCI